ncbi:uncharacterized protein LOC118438282 [Folsomia candida]|nr:uncharacterized protein LOC118438282 [Folsomia candida]
MVYALAIVGFDHVPIIDLGLVTYQSVGFGVNAIILTLIWWKDDEFRGLLNLLVTPSRRNKVQTAAKDTFSRLIPWVIPAVYGQSMCNSFLFVKRRDSVQYVWGLLDPDWKNKYTLGFISVYEFLIPMNSWNVALFVFFTYSSYTHFVGIHLKKLGEFQSTMRNPPSSGKVCRNYAMSYRQLQITTNLHHACFGEYVIPLAVTVLLFLDSWMTFATFKLAKSPLISISEPSFFIFPLGTFALFIVAFCFNGAGLLLFEESTRLVEEYEKSRMMRRTRLCQSLKPLKAQVGSFYYFKKISLLLFASNVVGLTINLLLTF